MSKFVPFSKPFVSDEEINEVVDTLRSGWLTTGGKTAQFEKEFAEYLGVEHAIAVNSATAGLHLALEAIGLAPGDKVVTTVFTFTATAEVVRYLGADLIFVDIDPKTYNMDLDQLEEALEQHGSQIKAIMPVHYGGYPCDMERILNLASEHDVRVIEDAAHAFPCKLEDKWIGEFGDATVFSFYANKTITTGEGGMVVTNNSELAKRCKIMRLHGIDRDAFDRFTSKKPAYYYQVIAPGFKYNMTDIAASIGIHQLRKAEDLRQQREAIAQYYDRHLDLQNLILPWPERVDCLHSWHLYPVLVKKLVDESDKDQFIQKITEAGVGVSVHYIPLHRHPYWRDKYALMAQQFPATEAVYTRTVSLPIYPGMTQEDVEFVADTVNRLSAA